VDVEEQEAADDGVVADGVIAEGVIAGDGIPWNSEGFHRGLMAGYM